MSTFRDVLILFLFMLFSPFAAGQALFEKPWPQATKDTCQSYAVAFALSRAGAPGFSVSTPGELRTSEREIRAKITSIASGAKITWQHWNAAVCNLTNNAYSLKIESARDAVDLVERMGDLAAETPRSTLPFLADLQTKRPTLVSVSKIGSFTYREGHIVSVFAVENGKSSPRPLLVLNPGLKTSENAQYNICTTDGFGTGEKDTKWSAGVSWVTTYTFTHYTYATVQKGGCQ